MVEQPTAELDRIRALSDSGMLVVTFALAGECYGLPIDDVQEVQQIVAFSQVPSGGAVVGMLDLRGEVIPAVDVRLLVGLPEVEYSLDTPMLIARTGEGPVALLVDEVRDVMSVPTHALQPAPSLHTMHDVLAGVARVDDGLVSVVDLELLLASAKGASHDG